MAKSMEHLAILKPKYFKKIENRSKTIESRWHKFEKKPYKNRREVKNGDTIYFKPTGGLVSLKAAIEKTYFKDKLSKKTIKELLKKYGKRVGVDATYYEEIKDKKYCSLIFIKNIKTIAPKKYKRSYGNSWFTKSKIF
jgi:ASC-1-like (ASCH) protein